MSEQASAVIFDWDNTLVDSWATIHEALNATMVAMDTTPWSLEESKQRVRLSLRDAFPPLFGANWQQARDVYLSNFERIHLAKLSALPDAATCLAELKVRNCYMSVVSNKTGRLLRREVNALEWDGYFSRVVGAGDAAADKPHRATIDLALSGSGIQAGKTVWYVGDTELDIETAHNADCTSVLIHSAAIPPHSNPETRAADHIYGDFASMLTAIRQWSA